MKPKSYVCILRGALSGLSNLYFLLSFRNWLPSATLLLQAVVRKPTLRWRMSAKRRRSGADTKERSQDAENEVVTYKCMTHWHHGKWNEPSSGLPWCWAEKAGIAFGVHDLSSLGIERGTCKFAEYWVNLQTPPTAFKVHLLRSITET